MAKTTEFVGMVDVFDVGGIPDGEYELSISEGVYELRIPTDEYGNKVR